MTHPFHPLSGRDFEFVAHRQNWGEDRVHLHDESREAAAAGGGDGLVAWAARSGRPEHRGPVRSGLRFVFYGRVSTEDWQDPATSRARQREQAGALVRGHGVIVAEFFDMGESRTVAWGRRPQAAALVAALADPGRGWDAIVIGEYERAFYGSQYASMAPLFEHYGLQLWMPEAGGRVDFASEHDEHAMTVRGLSSKREITRTSIRVRTAMAVQAREQGRYLGGRPATSDLVFPLLQVAAVVPVRGQVAAETVLVVVAGSRARVGV